MCENCHCGKEQNVIDLVSKFHKDLLERVSKLEKENSDLKEQLELSPKFYFDPNEDCYAFIDKGYDNDSTMPLKRIEVDGEISSYVSGNYSCLNELDDYMRKNGYNIKDTEPLKPISFTEFYTFFVKPIFKKVDMLYSENKMFKKIAPTKVLVEEEE